MSTDAIDRFRDAIDRAPSPKKGGKVQSFAKYENDPCAFALDVFGVNLTPGQQALLLDILRHLRLAVACGQRTGRTMVFALVLLFWCATRPNALGLLSTPSQAHMRGTVWWQIGELVRNARVSLGAQWFELPSRGVEFENGNQIIGIASDTGERLQGWARQNLLIVGDEFAGYPESLTAPLMSNLAGGGRVVIGGNPTNNTSYFAMRWKAPWWETRNISSLDVARSTERQPGMATPEWCQEMLEEYGEESILYRARVLGQFSASNINGVFSLLEIEQAEQRYDLAMAGGNQAFNAAGPLEVGLDVARSGADFSCAVARRGHIALAPQVWKIPDLVAVADRVLAYVSDLRQANETPTIKVDGVGVGAGVVDVLKRAPDVRVVEVQAAGTPIRDAYSNVRSESTFAARDWVRAGGCIARDSRLEGEMAALSYTFDARNKLKILGKDEIRRTIGRSTDRFDALALAVYASRTPTIWDCLESADFSDGIDEPDHMRTFVIGGGYRG